MKVSAAKTKEARRQHKIGVGLLNYYFEATRQKLLLAGWQGGNATPIRRKPGVPPTRTPEQRAKHLRIKRAKAARKVNR